MSVCNSGDPNLDAAVNTWLKLDKNPITRKEVQDDIAASRWDKLKMTMLQRQKFGTAGLRAPMAAGYKCMNDVVILQTAQGLCSYIQKVCNQSQIRNGVVVGYDGRYNSKRFAELTAKVFISSSIPVHLFSAVCPTPLVSFATIQRRTAAGVMVTASHNPKEDNGYKVYWGNGCQIVSPHDDNVLEEITQNLDIPDEHWNIEEIRSHELVTDCLEEITKQYMEYIRSTLSDDILAKNTMAAIESVYSAMHGVGYDFVVKAFEAANLKPPISVKQQQNPDPDFPTVIFPNPEEPECLELSKKLAEEKGVQLVLVNDPDADRLAVAEYDKRLFLRLGAYYDLVKIQQWGNTTLLLAQQGKLPLFAFEEAIGYMCNHRVPDKDGVSAAVQVASLASHLYSTGSTLVSQLNALYSEYGFHVTHNSYFLCHDTNVMQKIFRRIRNYHGQGQYPKKVGSCEITYVNDFRAGVKIPETAQEDVHLNVLGTGLDQDYANGEMVMFRCSNGLSVTVRTSGTEPKLKYYSELVSQAHTDREREEVKSNLQKIVQEFVEELLQPKENGLMG